MHWRLYYYKWFFVFIHYIHKSHINPIYIYISHINPIKNPYKYTVIVNSYCWFNHQRASDNAYNNARAFESATFWRSSARSCEACLSFSWSQCANATREACHVFLDPQGIPQNGWMVNILISESWGWYFSVDSIVMNEKSYFGEVVKVQYQKWEAHERVKHGKTPIFKASGT